MSGIFGIVSEQNCIKDLVFGTSYLQHRGQKYCGWAVAQNGKMVYETHAGTLREEIDFREAKEVAGTMGIGVVSSGDRQPISEFTEVRVFKLENSSAVDLETLDRDLARVS